MSKVTVFQFFVTYWFFRFITQYDCTRKVFSCSVFEKIGKAWIYRPNCWGHQTSLNSSSFPHEETRSSSHLNIGGGAGGPASISCIAWARSITSAIILFSSSLSPLKSTSIPAGGFAVAGVERNVVCVAGANCDGTVKRTPAALPGPPENPAHTKTTRCHYRFSAVTFCELTRITQLSVCLSHSINNRNRK